MTTHNINAFGKLVGIFAQIRDGKAGFTLIEALIVVSLLSLLATGALGALHKTRNTMLLNDGQAQVLRAFELARSRAVTGIGTTDQGVHVEPDKIVLFEGTSYPGTGEESLLPSTVSTDQVATDIVFKRLTATANSNVTVTLINTSGNSKTVDVTVEGAIIPN